MFFSKRKRLEFELKERELQEIQKNTYNKIEVATKKLIIVNKLLEENDIATKAFIALNGVDRYGE